MSNTGMSAYLTNEYRARGFSTDAQSRRDEQRTSRENARRAALDAQEHKRRMADDGNGLSRAARNVEQWQDDRAVLEGKGFARYLIPRE
ncbi:hypothetical protein [Rhodococcus qingshengii]|uniref:hypothetical protein n=1 Tax=Rhodococcus qingshengii TaxID=334542 RepID=UPI001E5984A3|nr:hypothetical protein [Rhodococcus qingshengii]UDF18767.1 hypothetical protein LE551_15655 [Rhodococcus qingshengii]